MKYRTKSKIRSICAICMLVMVTTLLLMMPFFAAHAEEVMLPEATDEIVVTATEPLTWEYLATVTGCAFFVLVFVQATKKLVDKLFRIPTALYAYIIAVVTMIAATAFTSGLTLNNGLLTLFNGWIVACTASRTYEAATGK